MIGQVALLVILIVLITTALEIPWRLLMKSFKKEERDHGQDED